MQKAKNLQEVYIRRQQTAEEKLQKIKALSRRISLLRGLVFLGAVAGVVLVFEAGAGAVSFVVLVASLPFLVLVKKSQKLRQHSAYLSRFIELNAAEALAQKGDFSAFDGGKEFVDAQHSFSYDLDVFGEKSLFQAINRTCTHSGKEKLAQSLAAPEKQSEKIRLRQKAIAELRPLLELRQHFWATGQQFSGEAQDKNAPNGSTADNNLLALWLALPLFYSQSKLYKFLRFVFPAISLVLLALAVFSLVPGLVFFAWAFFQLGLIGLNLKRINAVHATVSHKFKILRKYARLFEIIEQQNFQSKLLKKQTRRSATASQSLSELARLVSAFDNRLNLLFSLIFNALLLWDLQCVFLLEKWQKAHQSMISDWFSALGEFDGLCSLGGFAYNHPAFCFAEVAEGENFVFDLKQGGHPLLPAGRRVDNDFSISGYSQVRLITGANMAGKSTFLRTAGVNLLLAMAGSVVCAQSLRFTPISLFTSVRTNDSLQKSESYFYAELKRLQAIIGQLESGEPTFVIVDEMLRGTNSRDKHEGSAAFIRQLIRLGAVALVATHDIALGKLQAEFAGKLENLKFEVEIKQNRLIFNYLLQKGISQNLNASFLMRQMGITV